MSSTGVPVKTLELFNEKADQLLSSEFFKQAKGGGRTASWTRSSHSLVPSERYEKRIATHWLS